MSRLERKAREFIEQVRASLGESHPLATVFAGLMLVYYTDESDLKWVEFAMRPWFADAEKKSAEQERQIVLAALWLLLASQEQTRIKKSNSRKDT